MNKYLVEFLGTMFLMYTMIVTENWAATGAALAIAILLGGPVSGGYFNPAISCAFYAAGKLPKSDLLPYIIVEVLGALAAFYVYKKYINKSM